MNYKRKKTGELELFIEIYNERPHVSYISEEPIRQFDVSCFAHVLNKNVYPELRLEKINIALITKEEHRIFDRGTLKDREEYKKSHPKCEWDKLENLKSYIRELVVAGNFKK